MRKNKLFFYLCLLAFVLFGAISAQAKVLDASMKGVQNPALRIDVTQNQPHTNCTGSKLSLFYNTKSDEDRSRK